MIAIYPGRFDPVTNGHLDLVRRGAGLCERLVVGVYDSPAAGSLFSVEQRVAFIEESLGDGLPNVAVKAFSGLLPNFVRAEGGKAIIRGLRAVTDFSVEFDQALMYKEMAPEIEQIYLMSDLRFVFLSASRIREVARLGYDVSGLVPPPVAAALASQWPQGGDATA